VLLNECWNLLDDVNWSIISAFYLLFQLQAYYNEQSKYMQMFDMMNRLMSCHFQSFMRGPEQLDRTGMIQTFTAVFSTWSFNCLRSLQHEPTLTQYTLATTALNIPQLNLPGTQKYTLKTSTSQKLTYAVKHRTDFHTSGWSTIHAYLYIYIIHCTTVHHCVPVPLLHCFESVILRLCIP